MAGKEDEIKGRIKEGAGALTDNEDLKREGKTDQASASVKDKIDDAKNWAEDKVNDVKDRLHKD
ncbi:MAG: CsbD family protein [Microthrixaceae bacterium]